MCSIIYFSQSSKYNDVAPSSPTNYNSMNNGIEQLPPEIFLPPLSPFGPGTLLISRDGEDDVNSIRINTARTSATEIEYNATPKAPHIYSKLSSPKNSNTQENKNEGCDFLVLLKLCWSWFCGLDDSSVVDDHNDPSEDNVTHQHLRRRVECENMNEGQDFMLQHNKERPIIKWILNGNLIFLIVIEISLFVVFSLPVKYTFWRD
jgi:hypothetical protein